MRPRHYPIPTAQSLAGSALYYLSRFASSEAGLRRVLHNKLRRAAMVHADFSSDKKTQALLHEAIEKIIEKHRALGVLNDKNFATMKAGSLRRAGGSARVIKMKLEQKGISGGTAIQALDAIAEDMTAEEAEMQAAMIFAKRKRLGIYGKQGKDEKQIQKDYAAMARAGFSFTIAKKLLGGDVEGEEG